MTWIINNPWEAFMLLWSIILKPVCLIIILVVLCAVVVKRISNLQRKQVLLGSVVAILLLSVSVFCIKFHGYYNSSLDAVDDHKNYAARFVDVQRIQIEAAKEFGINPLKDRNKVEEAVKENKLARIRSCRNYQLAPMTHSIPYLTGNAADLLDKIGKNFLDSLDAKNICSHKIVVTSVLRTDADVERLMKQNSVAVQNSAHRYATTFDISYRQFVPTGLSADTSRSELKKVLAEVLEDLRNGKECYVKYESTQGCFHITVRR